MGCRARLAPRGRSIRRSVFRALYYPSRDLPLLDASARLVCPARARVAWHACSARDNGTSHASASTEASRPRTELHRMGDKECKNRVAREQAHACWRCGVPRERQRDRFEPSSIAGKAQRKKPCVFPLTTTLAANAVTATAAAHWHPPAPAARTILC